MAEQVFRLPDLGEGLTEGEVVRWLVGPGDRVALNQPIAEVETAKAVVELPSPFAGTVRAMHAAEGELVAVGAPLLTIEPGANQAGTAEPAAPAQPSRSTAVPDGQRGAELPDTVRGAPAPAPAAGGTPDRPAPVVSDDERQPTLVGPGPREGRRRRFRTGEGSGRPADQGAPGRSRPRAAPPVRKYARDHGVDLAGLLGTGREGRITREDVDRALGAAPAPAALLQAPAALAAAGTLGVAPTPPPTALPGSRERSEERVAVRGTRRTIAAHMVASASTIPHVTEFLTVDATALMELRERLKELPGAEGVRVTPLAIIARAVCTAVRAFPLMNASWDDAAAEIVVKRYVNLGFATDTAAGLVVPNIKDADVMGVLELAAQIARLSVLARDRQATPADLTGGTITITNVGGFGVESGTPIINQPECAIIATGTIAPRPWVVDGQLAVRQVMTVSVSFDHRIVDGAYAARFLSHLGDLLETPALLAA